MSGWGFNWAPEALVRAEGGCRQSAEGVVMVRGLCVREDVGSGRVGATDPASLALVLDGLLGVRHSPLHVVHRMFHVVLNPVNHLSLQGQGHPSSRGPPQGYEGAQGRISGKQPEVREKESVRGMGQSFSPVPFASARHPGTLRSSLKCSLSQGGGDHAEDAQKGP